MVLALCASDLPLPYLLFYFAVGDRFSPSMPNFGTHDSIS